METPFETGPQRYQAPDNYLYAQDPKLRVDQKRLAKLVGGIALAMPIVLGIVGYFQGRFRTALSEYFYEPLLLGDYFTGSLIALAALLTAYRGWTPKVRDLATLAGLSLLFVAFVPMAGWYVGCEELPNLGGTSCSVSNAILPKVGYWVHAGSAGVLFAILSFFCLFVFTKPLVDDQGSPLPPTDAKKIRNVIYIVSGIVIAVSAIAILLGDQILTTDWNEYNLTFWMEALILAAFGISWLTHGRVIKALADPQDRADLNAVSEKSRASKPYQ